MALFFLPAFKSNFESSQIANTLGIHCQIFKIWPLSKNKVDKGIIYCISVRCCVHKVLTVQLANIVPAMKKAKYLPTTELKGSEYWICIQQVDTNTTPK